MTYRTQRFYFLVCQDIAVFERLMKWPSDAAQSMCNDEAKAEF